MKARKMLIFTKTYRHFFIKNQWHGVKSTQFMSISTSKKVLSKIQQTKSDPEKGQGLESTLPHAN